MRVFTQVNNLFLIWLKCLKKIKTCHSHLFLFSKSLVFLEITFDQLWSHGTVLYQFYHTLFIRIFHSPFNGSWTEQNRKSNTFFHKIVIQFRKIRNDIAQFRKINIPQNIHQLLSCIIHLFHLLILFVTCIEFL